MPATMPCTPECFRIGATFGLWNAKFPVCVYVCVCVCVRCVCVCVCVCVFVNAHVNNRKEKLCLLSQ